MSQVQSSFHSLPLALLALMDSLLPTGSPLFEHERRAFCDLALLGTSSAGFDSNLCFLTLVTCTLTSTLLTAPCHDALTENKESESYALDALLTWQARCKSDNLTVSRLS